MVRAELNVRRLLHGHGVAEALACASRSIRRMSEAQRAAAYARLAGAPATGRVRDLDAAGYGPPSGHGNTVAHWAPFIHIGV